MTKPELIVTASVSEDVDMVNPEGFGSNDEGSAMQGVVSVCDNARKRGKELLGSNFEELEILSKRAKVEFFEDSSHSDGLIKALKRLTLSRAKRESCEGCSDRSKELADNDVSLAECLLHAEVLLEWVRTRDKLNARDDEVSNLKNQITIMENDFKDAAEKYTMVARIGMMLELNETKVTWNVREEIEAFKLKFPESNFKDWDVYMKLRTPATK